VKLQAAAAHWFLVDTYLYKLAQTLCKSLTGHWLCQDFIQPTLL